jgi:hypothetical protein
LREKPVSPVDSVVVGVAVMLLKLLPLLLL